MMRVSHMRIVLLAMVMLLPLLVACNTFEYGFDETQAEMSNPNMSNLTFRFDWDNVGSDLMPEEMTVLMSRKVNSLNYIWTLDGQGRFITDGQEVPVNQVIGNGEYYLVAFCNQSSLYQITDYRRFEEPGQVAMRDLYATVLPVSTEDVSGSGEVLDFNMYSGYVAHTEDPLYHYIDKGLKFPHTSAAVSLEPTTLTREFTLSLAVETEPEVSIDRVVAVLSGVPQRVQLMSGFVSRNETAKVVFDMERDAVYGKRIAYEGKFKSLGLFSSQDETLITGPGVLQVSLYASVHKDGIDEERLLYAVINLKDTIDDAGIMCQSEDKTGYWVVPQDEIETLYVEPVLRVRKSQVESGESSGYDIWVESDAEIKPEL